MAGNTALVCMAVFKGVGKRLHTLLFHPALGKPQAFFHRRTLLLESYFLSFSFIYVHHHHGERPNVYNVICFFNDVNKDEFWGRGWQRGEGGAEGGGGR